MIMILSCQKILENWKLHLFFKDVLGHIQYLRAVFSHVTIRWRESLTFTLLSLLSQGPWPSCVRILAYSYSTMYSNYIIQILWPILFDLLNQAVTGPTMSSSHTTSPSHLSHQASSSLCQTCWCHRSCNFRCCCWIPWLPRSCCQSHPREFHQWLHCRDTEASRLQWTWNYCIYMLHYPSHYLWWRQPCHSDGCLSYPSPKFHSSCAHWG